MISTNIAILEDRTLFREGLIVTLKEYPEINIIGAVDSRPDLVALLKKSNPDIVLLDLDTFSAECLEVVEHIRSMYPDIKLVVLFMFSEQGLILDLIRLGVRGFLSKNIEPEELISALTGVMKSGQYFDETVTGIMVEDSDRDNLVSTNQRNEFNEKELEVLRYICKEYKTAEIARALNLSVRTIEGYRKRLLKKSGSKNVAGLVIYTMKNSLLDQL